MHGTRDAGALWEAAYTKVLIDIGFKQGAASSCCFEHEAWDIVLVVHGDDFTAMGTDESLDRYEKGNGGRVRV